jgi:hypothetical protein
MKETNIANGSLGFSVHAHTKELAFISALCTEIGCGTFGRRGDELLQTSQDWQRNKTLEFVREIQTRVNNVRAQLVAMQP